MILAGCGSQTETPANAPAAPANAGNAGGPPGGPPNAAEGMERMRGNVPDISSMRDAMQNMAAMRGGPGGGGADAAILDDETGPHAEGKKVFKAQGCTRCHSVSAAGGRGGFGPMAGGPGGFPGGFPGRGRPGAEQAGDAAPGGEAGPGAGGPPGGGPPGGGLPGGGRPGFGGRGGMGGMMGMGRGPNLSKVGANPDHTVEWLSAHIRDPKTHNPQSRMPAYEGKISDDDLQALAEFLASLTGEEAEEAGQGQDKAE